MERDDPHSGPGQSPWFTSAGRWPCSVDSLPLPVSISMSTAAESFFCAARMGRERPRCCAPLPGWCQLLLVRRLCWVSTFAKTAAPCVTGSGYLRTEPASMTNSLLPTMFISGRAQREPTWSMPKRPWHNLVSMVLTLAARTLYFLAGIASVA